MNDQELIRKAIEEAVEEHDLEKFGGILRAGAKLASKLVPKSVKQGFKGQAPTGQAAAGTPKTTYSSPRMQQKYGPAQPSVGQKVGQNIKTATQVPGKVASAVKTAPSKIKAVPSKIKANPKTTAKVVAGTAGIGAVGYGAHKLKGAASGAGGPGGSGGQGDSGDTAGASGSPGTGLSSMPQKKVASRFMGRTGKSGHAQQMVQGYKPTALKMFKQYVDNDTVPAMAQSMPATSAEMPMAVLNESYQELMGSNLPPVKLKVDDKDPNVEKVTEAVMKQQDEWQSAQQIGAQVVDAMMYNPSMIPGAGKVKGLYGKLRGKVSPDAIKDMKFDESGMPIHPKTGEAMDEKQMTQFYGDVMGSKYAGAQGFGQQVGTPMNQQSTNIPPKPQQQKETNDKPV